MDIIYAIFCNVTPDLHNTKFYSTQAKARQALKEIVNRRCRKIGIQVVEDTEDRFAYSLGWEETYISFTIRPIEVA